MIWCLRYVIVAAALTTVMYGEDVSLPLDDGDIFIRAQFIRRNEFGSYVPELALELKNQTSSSWRTLKLQFDIGGLCNGQTRQWTVPIVTSLGRAEGHQLVKEYKDTVISLVGKVDGCKTEIIKARLVLAENSKLRIDGLTGERVDLERQLEELKIHHEAEVASQAEAERKAAEVQAEAQAKKDAAEAGRRKLIAAEQRKKDADARLATYKADMAKQKAEEKEEANAAFERRKIRVACSTIYRNTADKKLKDLTVKDEQQVRACQALGLYPPQ